MSRLPGVRSQTRAVASWALCLSSPPRLLLYALFVVCAYPALRPWFVRHSQMYLTAMLWVRLICHDVMSQSLYKRLLGRYPGPLSLQLNVISTFGLFASYFSLPVPVRRPARPPKDLAVLATQNLIRRPPGVAVLYTRKPDAPHCVSNHRPRG